MGILDLFRHKPLEERSATGTVTAMSGGADVQFNFPWYPINPTSEACIRKIVSTIAPLKLDLYAHRKGGGRALMFGHALESALREFCTRVERGEIRSEKTYMKFKALLEDKV